MQLCQDLKAHFATAYPSERATTYFHWVMDHLMEWTYVLHEEFGLAYGALSTQATEHGIKIIKSRIKHSLRNTTSLSQVILNKRYF